MTYLLTYLLTELILPESRLKLLKVARSEASQTGAKTQFNEKWPFQVIQGNAFWDHWKADNGRRIDSLYNNAGPICKVSGEIYQQKRWKLPQSTTPLSFDVSPIPNPHAIPANICINLIRQNLESRDYILPMTAWVYLHSTFYGGSEKNTCFLQ